MQPRIRAESDTIPGTRAKPLQADPMAYSDRLSLPPTQPPPSRLSPPRPTYPQSRYFVTQTPKALWMRFATVLMRCLALMRFSHEVVLMRCTDLDVGNA
ncbi:hypothetical protein Ddc_13156 [Ditylenchus destructor]|nr:hypothetical protein Ddc_13156 [Ditylenchus destructor]